MKEILVIGMGKVGSLVATLLQEKVGFAVTGMDLHAQATGSFATLQADVTDDKAVMQALQGKWGVVSCLPYHLNLPVARAAHAQGIHYFDLTEDVETTNAIRALAADAQGVMAPQCGLAPGFIGIVGASLTRVFSDLRSIELRVGALPQHPSGLLGYAFIWSPEGVVNEYLNDCEVIADGTRKMVPAMQELESVVIDGNRLEAFTTSGGLGTMCETYAGQVRDLNYKTLRYPGHCKLMRFFFHELLMEENRAEAGRILVHAKPPINDDIVYVHASVTGTQTSGLFREEFVDAYKPMTLFGQTWRAISWTTASSVCAVVELVEQGTLPTQGFLKQEEIPLDAFLQTQTGRFFETQRQLHSA